MRSPAPLQRRWEYLGGSAGWWEEDENQLSGSGEGGRLSSGGPGVERAADGTGGYYWDPRVLRVDLPALGGECPQGGDGPRA